MDDFQRTNINGFKKNQKTGLIESDNFEKYQMILASRKKTQENNEIKQQIQSLRDCFSTVLRRLDSFETDLNKIKALIAKQ